MLERLITSDAIGKAIAGGVQERTFGYVSGTVPALGSDGKYEVPPDRVRFDKVVAEDEIDMESGFLMMPQAVPQPAPVPGPGVTPVVPGPVEPPPGPGPTPPEPTLPEAGAQKTVEIAFSANRDQLFTAWKALANLADMAGKVSVSVRAESEEGFDRNKLQNGVIEPLREADFIE